MWLRAAPCRARPHRCRCERRRLPFTRREAQRRCDAWPGGSAANSAGRCALEWHQCLRAACSARARPARHGLRRAQALAAFSPLQCRRVLIPAYGSVVLWLLISGPRSRRASWKVQSGCELAGLRAAQPWVARSSSRKGSRRRAAARAAAHSELAPASARSGFASKPSSVKRRSLPRAVQRERVDVKASTVSLPHAACGATPPPGAHAPRIALTFDSTFVRRRWAMSNASRLHRSVSGPASDDAPGSVTLQP